MKSVLAVIGTRPEAIKMCPLIKALRKENGFQTKVAVTGQHREMLENVLREFRVTPDIRMEIPTTHTALTDLHASLISQVGAVFKAERPDLVLVHGDTATAFASALAAFFERIPIGHVEAGLRTMRVDRPFPEEMNRRVISMLSDLDFAPTEEAYRLLLEMGKKRVFYTGNTVADAVRETASADFDHPILERARGKRLILCTVHRRESLGDGMERMFRAVYRIAREEENVHIVIPLHKNPLVREAAERATEGKTPVGVELCEPLGVFECHNLLLRSTLVLTDSGGLQEEAAICGVPVMILREETERPEILRAGMGFLCGDDEGYIAHVAHALLSDEAFYQRHRKKMNLYGDGCASEKITKIIAEFFS
jgi:UDP-N-acetylglucosamine 2-epimerase (non-hydrolysing)